MIHTTAPPTHIHIYKHIYTYIYIYNLLIPLFLNQLMFLYFLHRWQLRSSSPRNCAPPRPSTPRDWGLGPGWGGRTFTPSCRMFSATVVTSSSSADVLCITGTKKNWVTSIIALVKIQSIDQ